MPAVPLHIETPLIEDSSLNNQLGKRIFLKMECYQPVGSFKIRGIGALCQHAVESGKERLISSSGGNAGYAAAYAGKRLGLPVTVVVPERTSETAKQRIAAEGAEIVIRGSIWDEADAFARELVEQTRGAYIHPFDNPLIWQGHASMIDEALQQGPKPDALAVCVGGGGLMCGIVEGMQRNGWSDVPILAVETRGADSFAQSVAAGQRVTLDGIRSIATTLGAAQVTQQALISTQSQPIIPIVVSDRDAVNACLRFADDFRVIVEPSCGATLSLLYDNLAYLDDYDTVLVIVCGGAGVTMRQLQQWDATVEA